MKKRIICFNGWKAFVLSLFVLLIPVLGKAGMGPNPIRKSLNVNKGNFRVFAKDFSADSLIVFFNEGYDFRAYRQQGETGASLNKKIIDDRLEAKDILFFRHIYLDGKGDMDRFKDFTADGNILQSITFKDRKYFEMELYDNTRNVSITGQYKAKPNSAREVHSLRVLVYESHPASFLLRDGLERNYYPNGALKAENYYSDGTLGGISRTYYDNGVLRTEMQYKDNQVVDGDYTGYHDNGKVRMTYSVKDGEPSNIKYYSSDGNEKSSPFEPNQNKKALLFSIGNYPMKGGWSKISTSNDITLIKSTLLDRGFMEANITVVEDEKATKQGTISALESYLSTLNRGDIAYFQFSSHGQRIPSLSGDSLISAIVCYDAPVQFDPSMDYQANIKNYLTQSEIEYYIDRFRQKLGAEGQLYFSIDASQAGVFKAEEADQNLSLRGETNNLVLSLNDTGAPIFIFTGSLPDELSYEYKGYGSLSYSIAKSLTNPILITVTDMFSAIQQEMRLIAPKQTPQFYSSSEQFLFEPNQNASTAFASLGEVQFKGNAYILSVGVSQYSGYDITRLSFKNSANDAKTYNDFFISQMEVSGLDINPVLLIDSLATKKNIIDAINRVKDQSSSDDYFIFNFSGYTKPIMDGSGTQTTYFVPYGLGNINDEAEISQKGISLTQLKDLLQFIPAKNQLFITEAGTTTDFQREFIKALMETSPTLAQLSDKNRVFLVPKSTGLDAFNCKSIPKEQGPINYFVTNLNPDLNIYGLFQQGNYANTVKYNLIQNETNCQFTASEYFDVFFEKDFMDDLNYYLPKEIMQTRGAVVVSQDQNEFRNSVSGKYALIVGNNKYNATSQWSNLNNPNHDANEIAKVLENDYGYQTTLLLDTTADAVYAKLFEYNDKLKAEDQLFIFFAGHGDYDDTYFDDGFLVMSNSKSTKEDPYRKTYVQYATLRQMVNKLPPKQLMVAFDVCFGGTFEQNVKELKGRAKMDDYTNLAATEFLSSKLKFNTRVVLTSGGKNVVPDGYAGQHSPFALKLLEALKARGGANGMLTAHDLFSFVQRLPSEPVFGNFGDHDTEGEYILVPEVKEKNAVLGSH